MGRVTGDVRPDVDPNVVTSGADGKKSDWAAIDDAAARAKALDAEKDPRAKVEVVVTSQVMLPPEKGEDGNLITTGKMAKRGDRITVTREFLRKYRGHFVETVDAWERQQKIERGEEDF